jgi:hypothetical protein
LTVPSLGFFVIGLVVYDQRVQMACVDSVTCSLAGALTAQQLQGLSTLGFSPGGYAAWLTLSSAISEVLWSAVGFLLFWRRSNDWLALLAAFFLVLTGMNSTGNPASVLALTHPALTFSLSLIGFLGQASLGVFFLLFPNGRLVSRWMGLILALVIIQACFNNFPSPLYPFDANWPGWWYGLVSFVTYGALIVSQIYRFRRHSTPLQRQQTKWVLLGVTAAAGVYIGLIVIGSFMLSTSTQLVGQLVANTILAAALLLIPLSIGFSILRYRLYDIDLLINRTLVYGTLTILLTLVYFGLVISLQLLVRLFAGQAAQSPVVIVVSTLAIAALFRPLRHQLQELIDRRFYRRKYDAEKTLAAFSATLREAPDLEQIRAQLLFAVQETMQPEHVSLWLRSPQDQAGVPRQGE